MIKKKLDFSYDLMILRHFGRYGVEAHIEDNSSRCEALKTKAREKFPDFDPEKDSLYFVIEGSEVLLAIANPNVIDFSTILKIALGLSEELKTCSLRS